MENIGVLRMAEGGVLATEKTSATEAEKFVVKVTGNKGGGKKKKLASFGATGLAVLLIVVFAAFLGSGSLVPAALSQRLMEETDTQYADLVESKKIVLQQALRDGEFPDDTAKIMKEKGYTVGYVGENGEFVANNKAGRELVIEHEGEIISAEDFVRRASTDVGLYTAITEATYDRAGAYYDEAAEAVFSEIGTNRSNFNTGESFEEVMKRVMGQGNAVEINSVGVVEDEEEGESLELTGEGARTAGNTAEFIEKVRQKNPAGTAEESAVNSADTLKVADQVVLEQRSSLFYALMMENISKMKAGDGNESKINDTMNFLTTSSESEVVDVRTGEVKKVYGSPLEAPSLYALLSGEKADREKVADYSEERVLATVRNRIGQINYSPVQGTVASAEKNTKGSIGRMIEGTQLAGTEVLQSVEPTIRESMVENGYESLSGVGAGEFLAMGAVNLSRRLAQTSGATVGDEEAVKQYARVNQAVLAMDAKMERSTKSPFDMTSKNTFLGSIMYKFAMVQATDSGVRNFGTILRGVGKVVKESVAAILPASLAEDGDEGFMTDFGECETLGGIGGKGTVGCSEIGVFDTSTLNDPLRDQGFVSFVEANTELSASGERKVVEGSKLGEFISHHVGRKLPNGVMDGGILDALNEGGIFENVPFIADIAKMIEEFLGASEEDKRIASGATYAFTSANEDWEWVKYAQRYVALARTTAMLKEHSSDQTAYREMKFFEGEENPVVAYLREHNEVAKK